MNLPKYLRHLVPELPLPLCLYNIPGLTNVTFEPETVRRAMDDPRIIGFKDSSGNMTSFHRIAALLKHRPDWSLLKGPEELLPDAVFAGGHGGINGGANLFPSLYVKLYAAARAAEMETVRTLHRNVMSISERLYRVGSYPSALIASLKCALSLRGICDDFLADPARHFQEPQRERVRKILGEIEQQM